MPLGWRGRKIHGGPYRNKPKGMSGIKMAMEINAPCDIDIPTRDFSVPDPIFMRAGLMMAIDAMADGEVFYVGCMGGIGRTGLFLSLLARALGEDRPVEWVREHYDKRAVETEEQRAYVNGFDLTPLKWKIRWAKLRALLRFWI
jgi:hypothetical protein